MATRTQPAEARKARRESPPPQVGAGPAAASIAVSQAAGLAAGTAAGATSTVPAAVGLLAAAKTAQEGVEKVLELLDGFFVIARAREDAWALKTLKRVAGMSQQDVLDVIADESARRAAFEAGVRERVRRDVQKALGGDGTPEAKQRRVRDILKREQTYAQQRSRAMGERALAHADRIVLRKDSPQGAFWKLGQAEQHTPDCLAMAGRFWPWEVLNTFHPPTHTGCVCSLHGYQAAVGAGWMKPGAVMDVTAAVQRAAAAKLLLGEAEVTELGQALTDHGLISGQGELLEAIVKAGGLDAAAAGAAVSGGQAGGLQGGRGAREGRRVV